MRTLVLWLALWPAVVGAEEWVRVLDDAGIEAALADRILRFDAHTAQRFGAAGDTQYMTDRVSDGRWAARAGQYCSQWPPSDVWACYDIQTNGEMVRFIGPDRSVSEGVYAN